MRGIYRYRTRRLGARAGETDGRATAATTSTARASTRRWSATVLDAQRRAVVELRNRGEISNDVMHRIERELDLEDERLEI